ncbi:MAG: transketolase [Desulfobacterales bacterium]|nr:transketolase [Desulfobacterales bacterium]
MNTDPLTNEQLDQLAREFRYVVTDAICRSGVGHIGGVMSLVEIVITLYWRVMKIKPEDPGWPERDRLVLSKGHAGPAVYTALAMKGFFPMNWLSTINQNGTRLPSHMDQILTPGVEITAGSLGQGLSCACGLALAARHDGRAHRVFCIIGDGESDEGQIWEAALFAAHNRLDNLVVICDYNKMQIDGRVEEIMRLEPLADKWRAFGWETFEVNGHDWDDIYATIGKAVAVTGKPTMIIAHTVKGKGNRETEGLVDCHNVKIPDQATYDRLMCGLECKMELPY